MLLLLFFLWWPVTVNPTGPLYLPIKRQETVTCHIASGTIRNWYIILQNGIEKGINPLIAISNAQFPGITGRYVPEGYSTLLITINTTNTSIAGLRCEGVNAESLIFSATINLTIYGKFEKKYYIKICNLYDTCIIQA